MLGGALFLTQGWSCTGWSVFFDAGFAEFCAGFRRVSQGLSCTGWSAFFLQSINDSSNAEFQTFYIEIYQETQFTLG